MAKPLRGEGTAAWGARERRVGSRHGALSLGARGLWRGPLPLPACLGLPDTRTPPPHAGHHFLLGAKGGGGKAARAWRACATVTFPPLLGGKRRRMRAAALRSGRRAWPRDFAVKLTENGGWGGGGLLPDVQLCLSAAKPRSL